MRDDLIERLENSPLPDMKYSEQCELLDEAAAALREQEVERDRRIDKWMELIEERDKRIAEQDKALTASIWHNEEDSKDIYHLHDRVAELEADISSYVDNNTLLVNENMRLDAALAEIETELDAFKNYNTGEADDVYAYREEAARLVNVIRKARAGDE